MLSMHFECLGCVLVCVCYVLCRKFWISYCHRYTGLHCEECRHAGDHTGQNTKEFILGMSILVGPVYRHSYRYHTGEWKLRRPLRHPVWNHASLVYQSLTCWTPLLEPVYRSWEILYTVTVSGMGLNRCPY